MNNDDDAVDAIHINHCSTQNVIFKVFCGYVLKMISLVIISHTLIREKW